MATEERLRKKAIGVAQIHDKISKENKFRDIAILCYPTTGQYA